jgi:iron complex outermembrane receptor protein
MHAARNSKLMRRKSRLNCSWAIWLTLAPLAAGAADPDTDQAPATIVVTATRKPRLIEDEPLRVEAVPAEEIEENLTVQPGNLTSLLNELPSVRLQALAPSFGGAGLQLRGMPARDTLVLTDGLPLLGTEPDAFGLLQTPPLDLERVEVIKGAASALYGGSSLGGVLNLVSRPSSSESALLANASSWGAQDLEAFLTAGGGSRWSGSIMGGAHYQSREDVNGDGWADIPGYRRFTLRPRIWWNDADGDTTFLTAGIVDEDRTGGTLPGRTIPEGGGFPVELETHRYDAGLVSHWALSDARAFTLRASVTSSHIEQTFGPALTPWTQTTAFAEAALNGSTAGHSWVAGVAFNRNELSVPSEPGVGHLYDIPAGFVQDEYSPASWVTLAGSARVDANDQYGTFVSPRLSALFRQHDSPWSLRASVAGGFTAPTPFVDEVEAAGLGSVLPLVGVHAERAITASLDAKWSAEGWDVNASVFTSEIRDLLTALPAAAEKLEIINAPGPRRAPGAEVLIGYTAGPLHAIASWSYLNATEEDTPGVREDAPLVPHQAAELGAIVESANHGRLGLEIGYTGKQALAYDPYRHESPGFFQLNALGELRIGQIAIFLNAINLTNVRQTDYDPLLRPSLGPGGNPITDVWAPLTGRTFNLGVRANL